MCLFEGFMWAVLMQLQHVIINFYPSSTDMLFLLTVCSSISHWQNIYNFIGLINFQQHVAYKHTDVQSISPSVCTVLPFVLGLSVRILETNSVNSSNSSKSRLLNSVMSTLWLQRNAQKFDVSIIRYVCSKIS